MSRLREVGIIGLVLAVGLGLKWHYSTAGADDLAYVLAPTTALVEAVTGATFVREAGAGYLSRELSILIAPSCAGVNFLVMAWCMTATRAKLGWLPACAVLAWSTTVVVNAIRIVLAAPLFRVEQVSAWLPPDQAHLVLGVALYLPALMLLHAGISRVQRRYAS